MNDLAPQTPSEALTLALTLAITAETDEQTQDVMRMAESIAAQLTPEQVQACQAAAKLAAGI